MRPGRIPGFILTIFSGAFVRLQAPLLIEKVRSSNMRRRYFAVVVPPGQHQFHEMNDDM